MKSTMDKLPERGKRMIETREEFERVADLYEIALIKANHENSKWRNELNKKNQKISRLQSELETHNNLLRRMYNAMDMDDINAREIERDYKKLMGGE